MMAKRLNGAIVGFLATLPMTAIMELVYRLLPSEEQYPLPPEEVETQLIEQNVLKRDLDTSEHMVVTYATHLGYGTLAGFAYSYLDTLLPLRPGAKGVLFGLGVWAGSYLGWLPAFGILKPVTQHPLRRTLLMIVAHIIWGLTAGLLLEHLEQAEHLWGSDIVSEQVSP